MKKLQGLCVVAAAMIFALGRPSAARGQAAKPRLVTQAVDESNRVTMRGNVHPWRARSLIKARLRTRSR